MKPHEQKLATRKVNRRGGHNVVASDGVVAMVRSNGGAEWSRLFVAAPDMARALLAIRSRVAEAGKALPRERDAGQMAAMDDSFVTIPTEMLRDAFAALRKAGVLP